MKMSKFSLTTVTVVLISTGCATTEELKQNAEIDKAAVAKYLEPTISVTCENCKGLVVKYDDPNKPAPRKSATGADVGMAVVGGIERIVTKAYLPAGAVLVAKELVKAGSGGNSSVSNNSSIVNTASGAGASTGGDGYYHTEQIGPDSQNSQSSTSSSVITTDNSNQGNATATPTIVHQPAPIVVRPEVVLTTP